MTNQQTRRNPQTQQRPQQRQTPNRPGNTKKAGKSRIWIPICSVCAIIVGVVIILAVGFSGTSEETKAFPFEGNIEVSAPELVEELSTNSDWALVLEAAQPYGWTTENDLTKDTDLLITGPDYHEVRLSNIHLTGGEMNAEIN